MGLFFPCTEDPSEELHPWQEELLCLLRTDDDGHLLVDSAARDLAQNTTTSDYDLDAGDLFKEYIDELVTELDAFKSATFMMSNDDAAITPGSVKVGDDNLMHSERLPTEALVDCDDLLVELKNEDMLSEQSSVKIPAMQIDEGKQSTNNGVVGDGPLIRAVSSVCVTSTDCNYGNAVETSFFDSQMMVPGSILGIRRTCREGDTQTLGAASLSYAYVNNNHSFFELKTEERKRKISRYQTKKTKRDFSRKIKYACRKALADSQPRVRGRFAKAEEFEKSKPCMSMQASM